MRKPEAYRQSDAFCLRQVQLLTSKAPVTVLAAPQDAEGLICGAYQLARGNVPQPLTKPEQTALLKALLAQPRKRELEQASYTLLFGGLSLAALTHLTRHRMQALCAPNLLKSARYDRYVLPESVQQTGLEAQYREAFRQAGEAAVQLRAAGAGEDVLSYLLLSGQTVPVLTTMNAGELYVFSACAAAIAPSGRSATQPAPHLRRCGKHRLCSSASMARVASFLGSARREE